MSLTNIYLYSVAWKGLNVGGFTLLFLRQASPSTFQYPWTSSLYLVLTHIRQRSGNMKVAWLFLPCYPLFISRWISSCSCLFCLPSLPCFSPLVVSLILRFSKKKRNSDPHCPLIPFALFPTWNGVPTSSSVCDFWCSQSWRRGQNTCGNHGLCQQERHLKEVLPLSHDALNSECINCWNVNNMQLELLRIA